MGILFGPFGPLQLLTKEVLTDVNYMSLFALVVIAFLAGSELFIPDLVAVMRSIVWMCAGVNVIGLLSISSLFALLAKTNLIPFAAQLSSGCLAGVALMFATCLLARTPATHMSVVRETRSKGPFVQRVLGVTVVSDVVILTFYAFSMTIGLMECRGGFQWQSVLVLAITIAVAFIFGSLMGKFIVFLLWIRRIPSQFLILPLGFGVALFDKWVSAYTFARTGITVVFDPLLICIIAGYVATNQTRNRSRFVKMLHTYSSYIFVPFFVYSGATFDISLFATMYGAIISIILVRAAAVYFGAVMGGKFVKLPKFDVWATGLAFISMAGVSIGLADQVECMRLLSH